jgi:ATP-dependent RNA helicase DBP3
LAALPQAEIDTFLSDNFITISDPFSTTATLRPITKFSYLPVTDPAQRAPFKDFKAPTPIQAVAWPFLLAGRDVIGVAETGSGKTMAFAVPCVRAISQLPNKQRNKGARAVVVSPTRELAMQSYEQITKLATVSGLQVVCVYGGVPKDEQRKALKTADIVVATPGRLNDLINEGCADLSKAKYVVLDEADRMLDKGFEEEIRKIINTTPAIGKRQTLMFTATWPESVRALAATFMRDPVKIAIGDNPTGDLRANARIVQKVEVVDPRGKEWRVIQLLKQYQSGSQKDDRILVFCLYKKEATRVEGFIRQKGFRVAGIHGDLSQEQRTRSLDAFKKGQTPVLVATDVAARGLDIPAVKLVVNCTFPLTVEDYVHRIGRTGRAGKEGLAITLFTEHDKAQSGA